MLRYCLASIAQGRLSKNLTVVLTPSPMPVSKAVHRCWHLACMSKQSFGTSLVLPLACDQRAFSDWENGASKPAQTLPCSSQEHLGCKCFAAQRADLEP